MDTSVRVSHEMTESSVTSLPSSFVEQYTTTTYVSTTKLHNRHTGDYSVNVVERSSIPIASEDDSRIKVFLKGPTGLAESEEGKEANLERRDGFKVKWERDMEDTKGGQKEGRFIWYGSISPGEEVVLVSERDVRACRCDGMCRTQLPSTMLGSGGMVEMREVMQRQMLLNRISSSTAE